MALATLTDTRGIIALAAAAVAVLALICCALLAYRLRQLRRDQRIVLGDGSRDLTAQAAGLQEAFEALREYVGEVAEGLEGRLQQVESSLLGAVSHTGLVHYDAYNELSGRQSVSIALLDRTRTGIVLTCIHHRDQARVYAKELRGGEGERELSPEEAEAVRIALAGSGASQAAPGEAGSAG